MVAQSIRNVTLYHGISQQVINALIVAHHLWKLISIRAHGEESAFVKPAAYTGVPQGFDDQVGVYVAVRCSRRLSDYYGARFCS